MKQELIEKLNHLEKLLNKISSIRLTDNSFSELESIIDIEINREDISLSKSSGYLNNLKETKSKELDVFKSYSQMPRKRIGFFNEVIDNLRQDIQEELDSIKFS